MVYKTLHKKTRDFFLKSIPSNKLSINVHFRVQTFTRSRDQMVDKLMILYY
jgi:hypothetical protein